MTLKLQFDPNQPYQLDAVENVARLFEGLPRQTANFTLGDEINPNLPPFESLSESWLYDNLRQIQQDGDIAMGSRRTASERSRRSSFIG